MVQLLCLSEGACSLENSPLVESPLTDPAPTEQEAPSAVTHAALVELVTLAVSLVVGVVVMPCLIYFAGHFKLGEYAHGGVFAFWRDFVAGLSHGSQAFWFVALAPYLLVWLARAARRLWQT
jgi:hypothetical protein